MLIVVILKYNDKKYLYSLLAYHKKLLHEESFIYYILRWFISLTFDLLSLLFSTENYLPIQVTRHKHHITQAFSKSILYPEYFNYQCKISSPKA